MMKRFCTTRAGRRGVSALALFSTLGVLWIQATVTSAAPAVQEKRLELDGPGEYLVDSGSLRGDQILDYRVSAQRSQILSVDLKADNSSTYFNVLPENADNALFIGATRGSVADVPLSESGVYRIRVYLVRAAARRGEESSFTLGVGLGAPEYADGLSGGPDYWEVNLGGGETLNLREGPSTRYGVAGVLRMGEPLQNQGCRMTGDERWCRVRATNSGLIGWAAGRYLREGPGPGTPTAMPGGPTGNDQPFDATGYLPCSSGESNTDLLCPFGVIRQGHGNAGIWVVGTASVEYHILFENGEPVAVSPASPFNGERAGGTTIIALEDEGFRIPDAVVWGG